MPALFMPCKHRWVAVQRILRDRLHWITVQRCRRCGRIEQTSYEVVDQNGKMVTHARNDVIEPKTSTPLEIDANRNEKVVNPTDNQSVDGKPETE